MNANRPNRIEFACQHVGLSGTSGSYIGNEFWTNADRSAAQWIKPCVDSESGNPYWIEPRGFIEVLLRISNRVDPTFVGATPTTFTSRRFSWPAGSQLASAATR